MGNIREDYELFLIARTQVVDDILIKNLMGLMEARRELALYRAKNEEEGVFQIENIKYYNNVISELLGLKIQP